MPVTTANMRIGVSSDPANNYDIDTDGAGNLLIKHVSDGSIVAKFDENGLVDDKPAFKARRNTAKGLGDNVPTYLEWQSIDYNLSSGNGGPSPDGATYTVPRTAIYTVKVDILFDVTSGTMGLGAALLWVNGVAISEGSYSYNVSVVTSKSVLSVDLKLNAGDLIAPLGRAVSTTARIINGSFSIRYVRSAT